jgi:hypothetical protein
MRSRKPARPCRAFGQLQERWRLLALLDTRSRSSDAPAGQRALVLIRVRSSEARLVLLAEAVSQTLDHGIDSQPSPRPTSCNAAWGPSRTCPE